MLGQGSPNRTGKSPTDRAGPLAASHFWRSGCVVLVLFLLSGTAFENARADGSAKVRLRVSWGGAHPEAWTGTITSTLGNVDLAAPLAFASEASASLSTRDDSVVIGASPPTTYHGVDLFVPAKPAGVVNLRLKCDNQPDFEAAVSLEEILAGAITRPLGSDGSQLTIQRAPGDELQVDVQRSHLVFRPGELWTAQILPVMTGLATHSASLKLRIVNAGGENRSLWSGSRNVTIEADGSGNPQQVPIPIPRAEGIYNLEMVLEGMWYQSPFQGRERSVSRSIQFIVLEETRPERTASEAEKWQTILRDSPGEPPASTAWPLWNPRRNVRPRPVQNAQVHTIEVGEQPFWQLDPGGWQAISLDGLRPGMPLQIEVDYLDEIPSALGISFLEEDWSGQVRTIGFDSGIVIPQSLGEGDGTGASVQTHRMILWPTRSKATLLLANRDERRPFLRGEIRIQQGPTRLVERCLERQPERRRVMAQIRSPYWAEMWGGPQVLDPRFQQPLDDWRTFYVAADRIIQILKHQGFDGAFLQIADEGSGLYPSQVCPPSPRLDSGLFFSNGQDPLRKDVLQMLLRMFEREGLVLVPTITVSHPLPGIESRRGNSPSGDAFLLIDADGQPRRETQTHLPRYNPLDLSVQREVRRWLAELSGRYSANSAWGGVGIVGDPASYLLLPGRSWGYDDLTIRSFLSSERIDAGQFGSLAETRRALLGELFSAWAAWRTRSIAQWHRELGQEVTQANSKADLYLLPEDIYRRDEMVSALSPGLHTSGDVEAALSRLGLQRQEASGEGEVVIATPHRKAPISPLGQRRVEYQISQNPAASSFFKTERNRVELFTHHSTWAHFAELQQLSFPDQQTALMRYQPFTPSGRAQLERLATALKADDSNLMIDGGWAPIQNLSDGWVEFLQTYQQLPRSRFEDVPCPQANPQISPVAVRQTRDESGWYGYVVNATPWKVNLSIDWNAPPDEIRPLGATAAARLVPIEGQGGSANQVVELAPFGLLAWSSADPNAGWSRFQFQLPEQASRDLRHELQRVQSNLIRATTAKPLEMLQNRDFEETAADSVPGWNIANQAPETVQAVAGEAHSGLAHLRMRSTGTPVWIRSNEIRTPSTGRLSITAWLRNEDPQKQPPLRIAVEGRTGKRHYYRFGTVGGEVEGTSGRKMTDQWQRFAVHFDDLPPEGMESLRIGFDLMGEGEVWIDSVHIYDRWLDGNDTRKITQMLAGASKLLSDPNTLNGCRQTLLSYWPRFLRVHFDDEFRLTEDSPIGDSPPPRTSQRLRRLRSQTPKRPLPFR